MNIINILFSVICMSILIGFLIVVTVLGTRSKMKYANQIREAQARGAFKDMNTPKVRSRIRSLVAFSLIGISGMVLSFAALVILLKNGIVAYSGIVIAIGIVFGGIGAIAGLLRQREITRRL